jgi:hypothetical protein
VTGPLRPCLDGRPKADQDRFASSPAPSLPSSLLLLLLLLLPLPLFLPSPHGATFLHPRPATTWLAELSTFQKSLNGYWSRNLSARERFEDDCK